MYHSVGFTDRAVGVFIPSTRGESDVELPILHRDMGLDDID